MCQLASSSPFRVAGTDRFGNPVVEDRAITVSGAICVSRGV